VRESWFEIKGQATGQPGGHADIYILDEIGGWGITAGNFIQAVQDTAADSLTVYLDTPGGDIFAGLTIANFLAGRPNVTTHAIGMAASMGAIILQAGSKRIMAENAYTMLHDPIGWAAGNSEEFRDYADWLDRLGGTLAKTVAARTGNDLKTVSAWMTSAETWFDAEQAKAANLVDEIAPSRVVQAKYSTARFHDLPAALSQRPAPPKSNSTLMSKFAQLLGLAPAPPATPPPAAPPAAPPAPPAPSARETFLASVLDAFGISPEALATAQADNKPGFAHDFVKARLDEHTTRAAKVDAALVAAGIAITVKDIADGTKDLKTVLGELVGRETARMAAAAGGPAAGREIDDEEQGNAEDLASVRAEIETETNPEKRACLARRARKLRTGRDQII
jgi:ATP-dependent Clp endopeptidase proteolytic subunit ClpP